MMRDPDVIAGQGTVAMEILREHPGDLNAIFVPVGGGGLIAGIAVYVKFVRPDIKIIGVEPDDADCLNRAFKANSRVIIEQAGLFVLIPNLQLGNSVLEALASRHAKPELRHLGSQAGAWEPAISGLRAINKINFPFKGLYHSAKKVTHARSQTHR
jgi:cysteine synthase